MVIHASYKLLPSAETGDFCDAKMVTLNVLGDAPPTNSRITLMNCAASDPVYRSCVNLTVMSNSQWIDGKYHNMWPDFGKPIKLSHFVFQKIPIRNIETTVVLLC